MRAVAQRIEVIPPEGVPLAFELATPGERFAAFLGDAGRLAALAFPAALWLALRGPRHGVLGVINGLALLWIFGVLTLGWTALELLGRGTTPGKRRRALRVIDAEGRPLTSGALIARNLLRHIEFVLPLQFVLSAGGLVPDAPGWIRLGGALWIVVLAGLPFFSRERTRAGDLVAGTRVVRQPRPTLLGDVASRRRRAAETTYRFTAAHLAVYGTYELQVLEDLLRMGTSGPGRREALAAVRTRIARKIGWSRPTTGPIDDEAFLEAYYAALRGHLEGRLRLGRRKRDKHTPEAAG